MTGRVFVGVRNGNACMRVSGPGRDVLATNNLILNSDFPCLRVHYTTSFNVEGVYAPAHGLYTFTVSPVYFPALAYLPIAFVFASNNNTSGERMAFPPGTGWTDQGITDISMTPRTFSNRIEFPELWAAQQHIRIWVTVFQNRIEV